MAGTLRAFTTVTLLAALLVMAGTGAVQAFTLQTSFAGIGECTAPGTTTTTTDPAVRPLAEQSRRPASTAGLGAVGATDLDRSSTSSPTQTPALAPKSGPFARWSHTKTPWQRSVYQRAEAEIGWDFVRPAGTRDLPGVTNLVAARRGYAPVRINPETGRIDELVLHHLNQAPRGSVVEVWRSTHGRIPHRMEVYWRKWRPDWATAWKNEKSAYWRWRTGRYNPPPTDRLYLPGDPR